MAEHVEVPGPVKKYFRVIFIMAWFSVTVGCNSSIVTPTPAASAPESTNAPSQILFDDFSYSDSNDMTANGWIVRSGQGWPGVPGATFRAENVSFVDYPNPE